MTSPVRKRRRTKREIYDTYQKFLNLDNGVMSLQAISLELDTDITTLYGWRKKPPTMGKLDNLVGTTIGNWKVIERSGYDKLVCMCLTCKNLDTKWISSLQSGKGTRCYSCKPSYKGLYLDDVKDLILAGLTTAQIANHLGTGVSIINNLKELLKEELGTSYYEPEYTNKEIGDALGLTEAQVQRAYTSGMRKLKLLMMDIEDLGYTIGSPE